MLVFLSKFLPLFIYPVGMTALLLMIALRLQRRDQWLKTCLIIGIGLLWLGGNGWVRTWIVGSLEWQYLPPPAETTAEVIVLLGGSTNAAEYPRTGTEINEAGDRLIHAARLYKEGNAPYILVSGGGIAWLGATSSESEQMLELLTFMGVPEEAIWQEPTSRNTYENALYVKEILAEKDIERVLLVTSAVHMPRAVYLFQQQGIDVIPAPADFTVVEKDWDFFKGEFNLPHFLISLLPNASNLAAITRALKEYIGLGVYWVLGL